MLVIQDLPASLFAILTTPAGAPATGILPAQVTCQYRRAGDLVFTAKLLDSTNFIELGNGIYSVNFLGTPDLGNIGPFIFVLNGAPITQFAGEAQVVASIPIPTTVPAAPPTCIVTGHVNDLSGQPVPGIAVSARVIGLPTVEGAVGLTDDSVSTVTDDNGVFFLTLVRLAVVEIVVPRINFRRQLTVPNQTTVDLFNGVP